MATLKIKNEQGVWEDIPAIRGKTPRAKGQYIVGEMYDHFDWVTDGGSSYLYVYPTPSSGIALTDETHWMLIAKNGATVVSATFANDLITFTKSDGTTFNVTLAGIVAATTAANNAATLANTKAGLADDAATGANAAKVSTEAATLAALAALDSNATWTKDQRNPAEYYPAPLAQLYYKIEGSFTQEGSGDPSPTNIRPITPWMANGAQIKLANSGKNLFSPSRVLSFSSVGSLLDSDYVFLPAGTYVFSAKCSSPAWRYAYKFKDANGNVVAPTVDGQANITGYSFNRAGYWFTSSNTHIWGSDGTYNSETVTVNQNCYVAFMYYSTEAFFDVQLELGSVPTSYEPYVGSSATLTAPEEIAAGWMDNRGNGQKTWGKYSFTGLETIGNSSSNASGFAETFDIAGSLSSSVVGFSHGTNTLDPSPLNTFNACIWTTSRLFMSVPYSIVTGITEASTLAEKHAAFKAYLADQYSAGTPVTVVYQLETPQTLTPVSAPINTIPALDLTQERQNVFTSSLSGVLTYPKNKVRQDRILNNSQLWRRTASGNPVSAYPVPESPLYPRVSGTFTQAGTGDPSPENIRPITPWLASGAQMKVKRTGKNLFREKMQSMYVRTDNGTMSTGSSSTKTIIGDVLAGKQYTISKSRATSGFVVGFTAILPANNVPLLAFQNVSASLTSVTVTAPEGAKYLALYYWAWSDTGAEPDMQLELGSTATPYEPYSGQEITLTAPQEIPAGWMDNEGNGEKTGGILIVRGANVTSISNIDLNARALISTGGKALTGVYYDPPCSHFKPGGASSSPGINAISINPSSTVMIGFPMDTTLAQAREFFETQYSNGTPVAIYYQLTTPIAITPAIAPLTALPQLDRVTPRQNVLTASTGNVELTYAKSPIREADELAAAIALL